MSVGSRIKELRENKGLSRNDLAELLNITVGAISNYENEVSSPKEPILFKIMDVLNCDANYLFQDAVKMQSMKNSVSIDEMKHIEKYRSLDPSGQKTVTFILDREIERIEQLNEALERQKKRILTYEKALRRMQGNKSHHTNYADLFESPNDKVNAAHKRTDIEVTDEMQKHDDAIMDDDSEWE